MFRDLLTYGSTIANKPLALLEPDLTKVESSKRAMQVKTGIFMETPDIAWSPNEKYAIFHKNNQYTIVSSISGKVLELGPDKPVINKEENSVYIFSSVTKDLYTYVGPQFNMKVVTVELDRILEVRSDVIVGTRKSDSGYFLIDAFTGRLLHHIENMEYILADNKVDEMSFYTFPNIRGFAESKGRIEAVDLTSLKQDMFLTSDTIIHEHDSEFLGGLMKVRLSEKSQEWSYIRKKDGIVYNLPNNFIRTYELNESANAFAVLTSNAIFIFKNGKSILEFKVADGRDLRIIDFSSKEAAFMAYDSILKRLVKITAFTDSQHVDLGPKIDFSLFMPKIGLDGFVIFQAPDLSYKKWNIYDGSVSPVTHEQIIGRSPLGATLLFQNIANREWIFSKEIK